MDAATVERVSRGRIRFLSAHAAKSPGSVRRRVQMIRQLLVENRLLVSSHCTKTIQMFKELRRGRKELDYIVRGDPNKHPFDSLSYPIYSEMLEDLEMTTAKQQISTGPRLIGVAL